MANEQTINRQNCVLQNKKYEIRPFEDAEPLAFHSQKNGCALLVFG